MLDRGQADKLRRMMWTWGDVPFFVRRKEEEIAEFRAAIDDAYCTLGAQVISGMPRASGARSSVERAAEAAQHRIVCYEEALGRIQAEVKKAMKLKVAIDEVVDDLGAMEQKVIYYRYREGKTWERVARMLHYDVRQVKRIEFAALVKMSRNVLFSVVN